MTRGCTSSHGEATNVSSPPPRSTFIVTRLTCVRDGAPQVTTTRVMWGPRRRTQPRPARNTRPRATAYEMSRRLSVPAAWILSAPASDVSVTTLPEREIRASPNAGAGSASAERAAATTR